MRFLVALILIAISEPAAAADVLKSVPHQFRGEWNQVIDACGKGEHESALRIDANRIIFYESDGPLEAVVIQGRYELALIAELSGEGQTWLSTNTFRLSPGEDMLIDTTGGTEYVRYRCPSRTAK